MPSGPKKRKAAKKKKAAHDHNGNHHSANPVTSHRHGDDNLKHLDDKESDAEEASSPTSEDHPNNHHLADGDNEDVEKSNVNLHIQPSSEEKISVAGLEQDVGATHTTTESECVADIRKELSPASEVNSEGVIVEEVEPKIGPLDEILLQSQGEEVYILIQSDLKPIDVVEPTKKYDDVGLSQHLYEENVIQIQNNLKPIDELQSERNAIVHVETLMESRDGGLLQNQDKEPQTAADSNVVVVNGASVGSSEAVKSFSESLTQVPNVISVGDNYKSVVESGHVDQMGKVLLPDEKINGIQSASGNGFMKSDVMQETEKNGEDILGLQEGNGRTQHVSRDLGSENKGVEALLATSVAEVSASPETEEKSMISSSAPTAVVTDGEATIKTDDIIALPKAKASASEETGENLMMSYTTGVVASNGADYTNKEERSRESQVPNVVLAQPIVKRTSWLNCCGLLDLFGGSAR